MNNVGFAGAQQRLEGILKEAEELWEKEEYLSSQQLLELASRSFVKPIEMLKTEKGSSEEDKEAEIRCTYNIFRFGDTGEDRIGLALKDRSYVLHKIRYVIGEVARLNGDNQKIEDIINGEALRTVVSKLEEGNQNTIETTFVRHFGRGPVLRELYGFDKEIRSYIHYAVENMTTGMVEFLERGEMQTVEQLITYCYYVAGSIGEFLTRLVKKKDGVGLNEQGAVKLGQTLQLVNILKNAREDHIEGRIYLPAEYRPNDVSHQYLMDGEGIDAHEARKNVLTKMLDLIKQDYPSAIDYILSIPANLSGYKSFCLVPTIMAYETIRTMHGAGAEAVFAGEKSATTINYGLDRSILPFVKSIAHIENSSKINTWLTSYKESPENYSFAPDDYEKWSGKWLNKKPSPLNIAWTELV